MHRGAFVTLASPHIKTVSLETIECVLVVCDSYPTSICISVLAASEVLCSQYSIELKETLINKTQLI